MARSILRPSRLIHIQAETPIRGQLKITTASTSPAYMSRDAARRLARHSARRWQDMLRSMAAAKSRGRPDPHRRPLSPVEGPGRRHRRERKRPWLHNIWLNSTMADRFMSQAPTPNQRNPPISAPRIERHVKRPKNYIGAMCRRRRLFRFIALDDSPPAAPEPRRRAGRFTYKERDRYEA